MSLLFMRDVVGITLRFWIIIIRYYMKQQARKHKNRFTFYGGIAIIVEVYEKLCTHKENKK